MRPGTHPQSLCPRRCHRSPSHVPRMPLPGPTPAPSDHPVVQRWRSADAFSWPNRFLLLPAQLLLHSDPTYPNHSLVQTPVPGHLAAAALPIKAPEAAWGCPAPNSHPQGCPCSQYSRTLEQAGVETRSCWESRGAHRPLRTWGGGCPSALLAGMLGATPPARLLMPRTTSGTRLWK